MNKKIEFNQIQKIHIAKNQIGLSDEQYRDILSGFITADGSNAVSCKNLSHSQAEELLKIMEKIGFKKKGNPLKNNYKEFDNRMGDHATGAQMRMLESMWFNSDKVSWKHIDSFRKFIGRITGKSDVTFLTKSDVQKVKRAIENL